MLLNSFCYRAAINMSNVLFNCRWSYPSKMGMVMGECF